MGNKPSSTDDQLCQDEQQAAATEDSKEPQNIHRDDASTDKTRPSKKTPLSLHKASAEELKKAGIRAEIAEKLAQESSKGRLKGLGDVVNVLENTGVAIQVKFDGNFHIEKDSSGGLSLQCEEEQAPEKKKRGFNFRRSFSGRKDRMRSKEREEGDPDWTPDEDGEEEEGGKRFKFKLPRLGKHSSKSEEETTDDNDNPPENENEKLDVNTATEEELEALDGIGPGLAKKIIKFREQNGVFHELDDLVSIRGISRRSLRKLSPQLKVGEGPDHSCEGPCPDTKLSPVAHDNRLKFGKREVIRIISWNLQCFSNEKAANEGVIEVICKTILENGVSVAVFQEIGDEEAILKIKNQLNHPTIKGLKKLKNNKANWECVVSDVAGPMFRSREYNGFLYDASHGIEVKSHDLIEKPIKGKKQFSRRPFLGYFKASGFDFVVVSVHLKATGLGNEDIGKLQKELAHIPDVIAAIKDKIPGEKDMVIVGDFNLEPDEDEFDSFRKSGLCNLIPSTMHTNISTSNMDGSKCYDNIWIGSHSKDHYSTGRAGVIRKGMTHPLIPDGWGSNGVVSDHCPVWGEFYCDRDMDKTSGNEDVEDIVVQTNT